MSFWKLYCFGSLGRTKHFIIHYLVFFTIVLTNCATFVMTPMNCFGFFLSKNEKFSFLFDLCLFGIHMTCK